MYTGNEICDYCIDILTWWANNSPLSYGEINVLLFVIVQPLLILLFIATTLWNGLAKNRAVRITLNTIAIVTLVLCVIGTIILIGLPYFDIATTLKMESDMAVQ